MTVFDYEIWPETMENHRNDLARPDAKDILTKLDLEQRIDTEYTPFGDGHAAEKIVAALEDII